MKKTVRTVEITWEEEVSLTLNRRRVLSNGRGEYAPASDGEIEQPDNDIGRLELAGGNDEKRDK